MGQLDRLDRLIATLRARGTATMAELASERMVLLSTHIVEDVSVLCPRFAIIREGRLVATTTPAGARAACEGVVESAEVETAGAMRSTSRCFVPILSSFDGCGSLHRHADELQVVALLLAPHDGER